MLTCCQRRHPHGARADRWAARDHSSDIADKWVALANRATEEHRRETLATLHDKHCQAQPCELRAAVAVYPDTIYFTETGPAYHISNQCGPLQKTAKKIFERRRCKLCLRKSSAAP